MIELFNIKKLNKYDFVQDTLPSGTGTWLCSLTAGVYVRGYSYNVVVGVPTRIEIQEDLKIQEAISPTVEVVCNSINNWFYAERQLPTTVNYDTTLDEYIYEADCGEYTFNGYQITGINKDMFLVGDLVRIAGSMRNDKVAYVLDLSTGSITLDTLNRNTTEQAAIFLMSLPLSVEQTINSMINYDIYSRPKASDKSSESIGSYSYTKDTSFMNVGSLAYPSEFVTVLKAYKKVRYVK